MSPKATKNETPKMTPVAEMICTCGMHRREHARDGLVNRGGHYCPGYNGPTTWATK